MDKKYNIILGIMIFLFVIIVGIIVAWGLGYIGVTRANDNDKMVEDTFKTVTDTIANTANTVAEVGQKNVQEIVSKNENINMLKIGENTCLNDSQSSYSTMSVEDGNGVYARLDNSKVIISVTKNGMMEDHEVTGVDVSNLCEIVLLAHGQDRGTPNAYFLMKDGTIQWLDSENIDNGNYVCNGKLAGITGVVRIANAGCGPKSGEGPGYVTTIGVKNDGTFYNLVEAINKQK